MSNKQKLLEVAIFAAAVAAGSTTCLTVHDVIKSYTDDICKTGYEDIDQLNDRVHATAAVAVGFAAGAVVADATLKNLNDMVKGYAVLKEVING